MKTGPKKTKKNKTNIKVTIRDMKPRKQPKGGYTTQAQDDKKMIFPP